MWAAVFPGAVMALMADKKTLFGDIGVLTIGEVQSGFEVKADSFAFDRFRNRLPLLLVTHIPSGDCQDKIKQAVTRR